MTTTTDFCELCTEFVEICKYDRTYTQTMELVDRAEVALATPPPNPPTDGDIAGLICEVGEVSPIDGEWHCDRIALVRAALKRWGNQVTITQTHND
jgi:hypothetical protein